MALTWRMTRGAVVAAAGLLAGVAVGAVKELLAVRNDRVCRAMTLDWLTRHATTSSGPAVQAGTLRRDDLDME